MADESGADVVGEAFGDLVSAAAGHTFLERSNIIGTKAFIFSSTLSNISGCCVRSTGNTEIPASVVGSAFILTELESRLAFGVLYAHGPLSRTFLLDALLRVEQSNSR